MVGWTRDGTCGREGGRRRRRRAGGGGGPGARADATPWKEVDCSERESMLAAWRFSDVSGRLPESRPCDGRFARLFRAFRNGEVEPRERMRDEIGRNRVKRERERERERARGRARGRERDGDRESARAAA